MRANGPGPMVLESSLIRVIGILVNPTIAAEDKTVASATLGNPVSGMIKNAAPSYCSFARRAK